MKFSRLLPLALCASTGLASQLARRDLASDLLALLLKSLSCTGCQSVLVDLKLVALRGDAFFVDVFTEVCILSKLQDPDVCTGVVAAEGPILAYDLRNMEIPSATSQLFCSNFFGLCPYPPVNPYTVEFPTEKPACSCSPAPSCKKPLKVVHISDIHVDSLYVPGSSANCTKPICCRPYTPSEAPGNNSDPAGPYGNVKCDAPLSLEESMYKAINELVPDHAFTLFTGDIPPHDVWSITEQEAVSDINDAYNVRMKNAFKKVYPTVGNHEAVPVNSFPPANLNGTISSQWVYDTVSADWEKWIGAEAANNSDKYGAYSKVHPGTNLRIISLNTNFYYVENFWLYTPTPEYDPNGQFAWLVNELSYAEAHGERVWIIGHMPMGLSDALHDPSNYFNQIVARYSTTIAGMFYGHTHLDQFEISYTDYNAQTFQNAIGMSYITPSLTPTSGNPAFRVYEIDPVTFGVLDYTEYTANIALSSFQEGPKWEKYYSAKAAYGPLVSPAPGPTDELTPAFWHNVTAAFQTNDTAFQEYYLRKSRGYFPQTCTGTCKTNEICQLRAAESQYNCIVPTFGVNFGKRTLKKRDGEGVKWESHNHDDCGASLMVKMFKAIVQKGHNGESL